jgi:hypothetical protein
VAARVESRPFAVTRLLVPAAVAAVIGVLVLVPGIPPLCPVRNLLHVPCPGCGFTRACTLAVHGHFGEATQIYPLWFVVAPLVVYVLVKDGLTYVKTGKWGRTTTTGKARWITIALSVLLIVIWAVRFFGVLGGPAPV